MTARDRLGRQRSPLARPAVRRIALSDAAARAIKAHLIARDIDYSAATVAAYVEALIRPAGGLVSILTSDPAALIPWIEIARRQCFNEAAARDLDQLIAALWRASNRQKE
jgi:hypothetical protein